MSGRANSITDTALRARWSGADRWLSDGGSRGAGRLVAKLSSGGATFYFQHFDSAKRKRFLPIGPHDTTGNRGMTLKAARDRAAQLSTLYRNGAPDLHAHFAREHAATEKAHRVAEEAAQEADANARRGTMRRLLEEYIAYLERTGKQCAGDVEGIFRLHVFPHSEFADKAAADLTPKEATELLRRITEAGKGRTAAKCRCYMRAAYSLALRADLEPGAPSALLGFNLQSNPIAPTGALAQYSRALDRVLTREELGAYVRRVQGLPEGIVKDALRLHLVLGGQRLSQMLRVTVADYDSDAKTLLLRDTKGARKQPRAHFVPLVEDAATILKRIVTARQKAGWKLIFTFDGKEQLKRDALTSAAVDIRAEMKKAKEVRADFSLRDLRRTVETVLAGMGVSRETRAQIQSHGLGGVQQRHYDRHDYMTEKRNALKAWVRRLRDVAREKKKAPTNVVDIKKGRPRQAKVAA